MDVEPEVAFRDDHNTKITGLRMKIRKLLIMASALFVAVQARATLYDLVYTQVGETDVYGQATPPSVTAATGQIDVVGGFAISGTLDVTEGPDMANPPTTSICPVAA